MPPVLVPRHSEWPPMHHRLPPPYHTAPQENSMPVNASFPANFRQSPGEDTPSPFRQGDNFTPYEMPGKNKDYIAVLSGKTTNIPFQK